MNHPETIRVLVDALVLVSEVGYNLPGRAINDAVRLGREALEESKSSDTYRKKTVDLETERANFELLFDVPDDCVWNGQVYQVTGIGSPRAQSILDTWHGWIVKATTNHG